MRTDARRGPRTETRPTLHRNLRASDITPCPTPCVCVSVTRKSGSFRSPVNPDTSEPALWGDLLALEPIRGGGRGGAAKRNASYPHPPPPPPPWPVIFRGEHRKFNFGACSGAPNFVWTYRSGIQIRASTPLSLHQFLFKIALRKSPDARTGTMNYSAAPCLAREALCEIEILFGGFLLRQRSPPRALSPYSFQVSLSL